MADAEIFSLHRLLLAQKLLTKTRTLRPKNHPRSPDLRLMLTSSAHIDYCWLCNLDENWVPSVPKISSKPNYTADTEIFRAYILLLAQKPLTKTSSLLSQKSSSKPSYTADAEIFQLIDYCWLRNRWWKLSPWCPKNQPRNPILRLTLKSSFYIDYCCLINRWRKLGPWDPKIIQEA